ncbi:acidic leucine-rich nuclear phosphoprotein 32-related protein-like [Vicia villosa]|uniref:acidic leucine-rich nuclear phosphoprotein 32-related protein-like n=1 Tax=Vicia villosa TaxID=3911 RepID=UPI00273C6C62|nr:acidic leucine-rich nuclear phosphoprotein 32-related protein-like [Vicia villosa]
MIKKDASINENDEQGNSVSDEFQEDDTSDEDDIGDELKEDDICVKLQEYDIDDEESGGDDDDTQKERGDYTKILSRRNNPIERKIKPGEAGTNEVRNDNQGGEGSYISGKAGANSVVEEVFMEEVIGEKVDVNNEGVMEDTENEGTNEVKNDDQGAEDGYISGEDKDYVPTEGESETKTDFVIPVEREEWDWTHELHTRRFARNNQEGGKLNETQAAYE